MESDSKRRKVISNVGERRGDNEQIDNNPTTIFGHGCKGLLITCDRNKENMAAKDAYRLLEEVSAWSRAHELVHGVGARR